MYTTAMAASDHRLPCHEDNVLASWRRNALTSRLTEHVAREGQMARRDQAMTARNQWQQQRVAPTLPYIERCHKLKESQLNKSLGSTIF